MHDVLFESPNPDLIVDFLGLTSNPSSAAVP